MAIEARRQTESDSSEESALDQGAAGQGLARLAGLVDADGALLYTIFTSGEAVRLVPLATFGKESARLRAELAGAPGEAFARDVLASLLPAAWPARGMRPSKLPRWCRRIKQAPFALPGLALPLPASRGSGGIALFLGEALALTEATVCDIHVNCLMLFRSLSGDGSAAASPLSPRELECLRLTADGLTSDEIAARLGLSVHTANQYLSNTIAKLNAVNRMHAVAKALRAGLFD